MLRLRNHHATALVVISLPLLLCGRDRQDPQPRASRDGDTVYVRAVVTDMLNRYVTDLEQKSFKLVEDRAEQKIGYFAQKAAPMSMGIVMDATRNLELRVDAVRKTIARLLASGDPSDDMFLITFDRKSARIESYSGQNTATEEIPSFGQVAKLSPLDSAFDFAVNQMKQRANRKKALIVITSSPSLDLSGEASSVVSESYARVYSISGGRRIESSRAYSIQETSGGRPYFLTDFGELDYYIGLIHTELRSEYILGYSPKNAARDGKWRKISVELKLPSGSPMLTVAADKGYYAPKN